MAHPRLSINSLPPPRSVSDFKDTSAPRFGHSDVVFDLFLETCFFAFNRPLKFFNVSNENILTNARS